MKAKRSSLKILASVAAAIAFAMSSLAALDFNVEGKLFGGYEPSVENGDMDGDGTRDISDVIRLLDHLFNGGPPPIEARCHLDSTVILTGTRFPATTSTSAATSARRACSSRR